MTSAAVPVILLEVRIVAIGGGDLGAGETGAIDRFVIALTGKSHPRALFLPTASFDDRSYVEIFRSTYSALGCSTDVAYLWEGYESNEIQGVIQATKWNEFPHRWSFRGDLNSVEEKIASSDLIYVGGGNTRRMMELWRSIGADRMLLDAGNRGTVLSGLSAGCICWGRYGNSDAALTEGLGKPTMRVECLDFLPLALCPHMSREAFRLGEFQAMMRETPGTGIGLDDGCALAVVENEYRILSSIDGAVAHRVTDNRHEVIHPSAEFRSLESLVGI